MASNKNLCIRTPASLVEASYLQAYANLLLCSALAPGITRFITLDIAAEQSRLT